MIECGHADWPEDIKTVEVWFLRQDKGMKMGFWGTHTGDAGAGLPNQLTFEDGKLAGTRGSGAEELDLDG